MSERSYHGATSHSLSHMKEVNVLFNDTLGYMASDMVKDHSDSDRANPLPPHGLLFLISSIRLYAPTLRHDSTYLVTPVVEHCCVECVMK